LQIADQARADLGIDRKCDASTEIDGSDGKRLVHRHKEIAGAENAALVSKSAIEGFAQCNSDVLDRVVLIHVEIAVTLQLQVKRTMAREELEHVIEEANPGRDLVLAGTFDREIDCDACLGGIAR